MLKTTNTLRTLASALFPIALAACAPIHEEPPAPPLPPVDPAAFTGPARPPAPDVDLTRDLDGGSLWGDSAVSSADAGADAATPKRRR